MTISDFLQSVPRETNNTEFCHVWLKVIFLEVKLNIHQEGRRRFMNSRR